MEQRIIELETKVAFLEDVVQQLNMVVADQTRAYAELVDTVAVLKEQVRTATASLLNEADDNSPPPHY
ncbi:MAG: SlyX family protein [Gammaproteobacteria bacterium]|nr:MAG: SlyX family protein [Gammaproteobacteria bacterium]